jgi:aspartyl/glutamyl-tRNA(Asn/Gln) amidotransferase C subunit
MPQHNIDEQAIEQIAKTACLELDEKSKIQLIESLGNMVDLFVAMDKIQVCPTKQSDFNQLDYSNILPADQPCAETKKKAGDSYTYYDEKSGFFTVPKVLNNEG